MARELMEVQSDEEYMYDDNFDSEAYQARAKEIKEGIDPPPGFKPGSHKQLVAYNASTAPKDKDDTSHIHKSFDYMYCLIPDLLQIINCPFYWGKINRYEAEKLLQNQPEGTFLLRDSTQDENLFSLSFRKFKKSLHSRIEQWNHRFSFDVSDPTIFSSPSVCGLIEHYIKSNRRLYFEPHLITPLRRNFIIPLQHMCRAAVCNMITYDDVDKLKIPMKVKSCLKEYHYKQRVKIGPI